MHFCQNTFCITWKYKSKQQHQAYNQQSEQDMRSSDDDESQLYQRVKSLQNMRIKLEKMNRELEVINSLQQELREQKKIKLREYIQKMMPSIGLGLDNMRTFLHIKKQVQKEKPKLDELTEIKAMLQALSQQLDQLENKLCEMHPQASKMLLPQWMKQIEREQGLLSMVIFIMNQDLLDKNKKKQVQKMLEESKSTHMRMQIQLDKRVVKQGDKKEIEEKGKLIKTNQEIYQLLMQLQTELYGWSAFKGILIENKGNNEQMKKNFTTLGFFDSIQEETLFTEGDKQNPPTIHFTLKQDSFKEMNNYKCYFSEIEELSENNPELSAKIMDSYYGAPPTPAEIAEDQEIKDEIQKKVRQNQDDDGLVLLELKKYFQNENLPLLLSRKSTAKSRLCMKIIATGFWIDQIKAIESIQEDEKWTFRMLVHDPQKRSQFLKYFKRKTAIKLGLREDQIFIHRIMKGSIKVEYSTSDPNVISKQGDAKDLILHRYFKKFKLSPEEFDPRGNRHFPEDQMIDTRGGGWPYLPPKNCKRYGLRVSGLYDSGSDDWLMMDENPNEWAIAFHGVGSPEWNCQGKLKVLQSIMKGKKDGQMLRAGGAQVHQNRISLNRPNQKVGRGIYCTPHMYDALDYTDTCSKDYRLIYNAEQIQKRSKFVQEMNTG